MFQRRAGVASSSAAHLPRPLLAVPPVSAALNSFHIWACLGRVQAVLAVGQSQQLKTLWGCAFWILDPSLCSKHAEERSLESTSTASRSVVSWLSHGPGLIKITIEAGLYNLPVSFPAWKCQDLETSMRGTISVDSLMALLAAGGLGSSLSLAFRISSSSSSLCLPDSRFSAVHRGPWPGRPWEGVGGAHQFQALVRPRSFEAVEICLVLNFRSRRSDSEWESPG